MNDVIKMRFFNVYIVNCYVVRKLGIELLNS